MNPIGNMESGGMGMSGIRKESRTETIRRRILTTTDGEAPRTLVAPKEAPLTLWRDARGSS